MQEEFRFYKLKNTDINCAVNLINKVFNQFVAYYYSDEGISEFNKFMNVLSITEKYEKGEIELWGCSNNERLVGVLATKGINHICLFYVDKDYQRKGIAKRLLQIVVDSCKTNKKDSITVNASPYANSIYSKLGFVDTDKEKTTKGIRYTPKIFYLNNK